MRDSFQIEAVGTLKSVEKWQSKKGFVYVKGVLSCGSPAVEIPFSSFNDDFNNHLLNDGLKNERIWITGRGSEWNDGINAVVSQFARAGSEDIDRADFVISGTLKEVQEDGSVLFISIETKQRQGNEDALRSIDVLAWDTAVLKEKIALAAKRKVLGRGVLKQIKVGENGNDVKLACWLESFEILSERIAGAIAQDQMNLPPEPTIKEGGAS